MITIFGTTYFTIGAGLVVLVLVAPFLFWFSRWALRPNIEDKPRRVRWLAVSGLTFVLLLLTAVGLFWDVYLIGQRAKELCAETGLVVNKRVSTNSLAGVTSIQNYQVAGLSFVEDEVLQKRYRFSLKDGATLTEPISEFSSRYQLTSTTQQSGDDGERIAKKFLGRIDRIIDRETGEVAGFLRETSIHAGWVDRAFFQLTGFTYKPWTCGRTRDGKLTTGIDRATHQTLILAVIENPTDPGRDRNGHQRDIHESTAR